MPPKVEEGLCQLLAYMWLSPAIETGVSTADRACGEYFKFQIMHNQTETYGDGFREALFCYETVGLAALLDHVRAHRSLPLS